MQIEAAFSLSEEYYKFMSDFAQTSFEDDKLLGKFYTDFTVAKRMVETIVEVALRTIKFSGVCGIVSPASLFNDQVSGELRKWIFENYKVADITYYPAELKLYGKECSSRRSGTHCIW